MRLVHLADLHLGFRQYYRATSAGLNQREADIAGTFRRAVDAVIERRPDVIVIAGDVFHTVRPHNPAIIHAFNQLRRLKLEVPTAEVVMIAGNHDRPRASETGCILRLFSSLGIHVVDEGPKWLTFPDLRVLAVPDMAGHYPALAPPNGEGSSFDVLLLHGEVQGMMKRTPMDKRAAEIPLEALSASLWDYVALGHYHVHRKVAENIYYAGSIDYTSSNPWGEMVEEREAGIPGKGFIEWDLEQGVHTFHPLTPSRVLVDLPAIAATGLEPKAIDEAIAAALAGCDGGVDGKIVRLVVRDVPRTVARDLDERLLREARKRALYFHLDVRRPAEREHGMPLHPSGRRATIDEMFAAYIDKQCSPEQKDALTTLGLSYLEEAKS